MAHHATHPITAFAMCAALGAAWPCGAESCYADCDGSGDLDFFDFLCFQNQFALQTPYADCDESGGHDLFDFLCFQDEFAAGCSPLEIVPLGIEPAPPLLCGVEVTAFEVDPRLIFSDVTTVESPLGGELAFDLACNIRQAGCIAGICWGRGYTGKIYYTNGSPRIEISVPGNRAFYFYMIPNPFAEVEYEVAALRRGAQTSIREVVSGFGGDAEGFAICGGVEAVIIQATDGVSDFAFGEFSIAD